MHPRKITNFKNEHPKKEFPKFRSLNPSECSIIATRVGRYFGNGDISGVKLAKYIRANARLLQDLNAESESFDFSALLHFLGMKMPAQVFLNWGHFDDIDQMETRDFADCFSDIWYPSADDIDVFDESLGWIISIGYSGQIYFSASEGLKNTLAEI